MWCKWLSSLFHFWGFLMSYKMKFLAMQIDSRRLIWTDWCKIIIRDLSRCKMILCHMTRFEIIWLGTNYCEMIWGISKWYTVIHCYTLWYTLIHCHILWYSAIHHYRKWYTAIKVKQNDTKPCDLLPPFSHFPFHFFLLFLAADIKCCRIRLSSEQSFVAWDVFLLLRIIEAWLLRLQQRQQDQHYPTGAVIFFPSIGIRTFFEYFMPEMFCTFAPDSISKRFWTFWNPYQTYFIPSWTT